MKKVCYVCLTMFLGFLLAFLSWTFFELWCFKFAAEQLEIADLIRYPLFAIGTAGGYFLGQCWWRIVYIEKRHWRFRKK